MFKKKCCTVLFLCLILIFFSVLAGCADTSDDTAPSTNACSVIGLNSRIINGTSCSETGSAVVRLDILTTDGNSLCSGTLITPRHVLTAAHCFFSPTIAAAASIGQNSAQAKRVDLHPQVRIDENEVVIFNDVAVVTLASDLSSNTLPILVSRDLKKGDIISIFGFGKDENDNVGNLESGQMKTSDVTDFHILASFNGKGSNSCSGDSGGPAVFQFKDSEGNLRTGVVGLVSSGRIVECTEGDLSFFTNVQGASVLNFITSVVPSAALN